MTDSLRSSANKLNATFIQYFNETLIALITTISKNVSSSFNHTSIKLPDCLFYKISSNSNYSMKKIEDLGQYSSLTLSQKNQLKVTSNATYSLNPLGLSLIPKTLELMSQDICNVDKKSDENDQLTQSDYLEYLKKMKLCGDPDVFLEYQTKRKIFEGFSLNQMKKLFGRSKLDTVELFFNQLVKSSQTHALRVYDELFLDHNEGLIKEKNLDKEILAKKVFEVRNFIRNYVNMRLDLRETEKKIQEYYYDIFQLEITLEEALKSYGNYRKAIEIAGRPHNYPFIIPLVRGLVDGTGPYAVFYWMAMGWIVRVCYDGLRNNR